METKQRCAYPSHPNCKEQPIEGGKFCQRHTQEYANLRKSWDSEDGWDDDWKRYDHTDHQAGADYYEGVLAGQRD